MTKQNIWISLCGCDDTTAFQMEVTEAEKAFVERMCALSVETSTYGCEPTMEMTEVRDV